GKAEGIFHAGNFCDDRIIRGGVRKLCGEDPLCGLRDCCLNEICCHIVSYSIASRSPKVAKTMSKSLICELQGGRRQPKICYFFEADKTRRLPLCIFYRYGIVSRYLAGVLRRCADLYYYIGRETGYNAGEMS
ncbi:MAG: hypothetical protein PHR14_10765, partial [Oscillospiraceae bacterium]|nr:hypothetical protein [Oscillospiraceae bacterium]